MCACVSTNPGVIVLPLISMILASLGTVKLPETPTFTMRLFSIKISPFSITSLPFIVMIRPPLSRVLPFGIERLYLTFTLYSSALNFGLSFFLSSSPLVLVESVSFLALLSSFSFFLVKAKLSEKDLPFAKS